MAMRTAWALPSVSVLRVRWAAQPAGACSSERAVARSASYHARCIASVTCSRARCGSGSSGYAVGGGGGGIDARLATLRPGRRLGTYLSPHVLNRAGL